MKKHETVRPMTKGQRNDLAKTVFESIPNISFEDGNAVLSSKGPLVADLRSVFEKYMPSSLANRQLQAWQKIYHDHFGVELGPVAIPTHRKGFDRLIVVAQGITIQQAYDACKKLFPCWKSMDRDFDEAIPTNERVPNTSYAIWARDRIEADEEFKSLSVNNLKAKSVTTLTVLERILFELKYFIETGGHLDINNVTLCAGSRGSDGSVPSADWHGSKFYVHVLWCDPAHSNDDLRAREAVS